MEENTLNISKIVIECLKTVGKVDYTDMTSKFECSSQTLLNWRQGKNEPNKPPYPGSRIFRLERLWH